MQPGGLGQAGQRLVGALHDEVGPGRHGAAPPAAGFGQRQIVGAVGLVHEEGHAPGVAEVRDGLEVALDALVGGAGQNDAPHGGVGVQGGGHRGGGHAAVDAEVRHHGGRQIVGGEAAQLEGVVDGLVAVAGHQDLAAEGGGGADARQQPHGGAAHQVPAPGGAVEGGGAAHGVGQDTVGVVEVVGALDLGEVEGVTSQPRRRSRPPLVPRHVQGIPRRGQRFTLLL